MASRLLLVLHFRIQRIDLLDRRIAHHLLDDVDHSQHRREANNVNPGYRAIKMRQRQRKPELHVIYMQHRHGQELRQHNARANQQEIRHGRLRVLEFGEQVHERDKTGQGNKRHLYARAVPECVSRFLLGGNFVSECEEFQCDLQANPRQQALDKVARHGQQNVLLPVELPYQGLHRGSQENDESHVFHAKTRDTHRQHGREACGDARRANIIAGPDKSIDPADETGKRDGCERNFDGVIGHQCDADRQGNGHCAGYNPGLYIASKILAPQTPRMRFECPDATRGSGCWRCHDLPAVRIYRCDD